MVFIWASLVLSKLSAIRYEMEFKLLLINDMIVNRILFLTFRHLYIYSIIDKGFGCVHLLSLFVCICLFRKEIILSVKAQSIRYQEMITKQIATKFRPIIQNFTVNRAFSLNYSKRAMSIESNLIDLFLCGVRAVQPKNLFRPENVFINSMESTIVCNFNGKQVKIDISGDKRCHLVGFGKGVYGMANELTKLLGKRLKSGIISVPLNIQKTFNDIQLPDVIRVFEGAKNNLPDENAKQAAIEIVEFTKSLNENDILFVLITGGGSSLLPLPCDGVSLDEKSTIIKQLASKGAKITDINRVRSDLSQTKGGKLALSSRNAGTVVAFIISDIIGDPLHLIASGPTVCLADSSFGQSECSIDILKRFDLWHSLPEHIAKILIGQASLNAQESPKVENVQNMIIANNEIAVNAILREVNARKLNGIILSTAIEGLVADLSKAYFELSKCIQLLKHDQINENHFLQQLTQLREVLSIRDSFFENIVGILNESKSNLCDLCIIGAGEPTVQLTGNGVGGRNQEISLRFSEHTFQDRLIMQDVYFLSAGTDGIDGPSNAAAGAIGGVEIIQNYLMTAENKQNDIKTFIQNNDSFNFYSNLSGGKYHVVCGHTGTNVMDLHLLYFKQSRK